MNRLSRTDRERVIACLVEGNSIRATVRITGIAKKTVSRLGVELGEACEKFSDKVMVNLPEPKPPCSNISWVSKIGPVQTNLFKHCFRLLSA